MLSKETPIGRIFSIVPNHIIVAALLESIERYELDLLESLRFAHETQQKIHQDLLRNFARVESDIYHGQKGIAGSYPIPTLKRVLNTQSTHLNISVADFWNTCHTEYLKYAGMNLRSGICNELRNDLKKIRHIGDLRSLQIARYLTAGRLVWEEKIKMLAESPKAWQEIHRTPTKAMKSLQARLLPTALRTQAREDYFISLVRPYYNIYNQTYSSYPTIYKTSVTTSGGIIGRSGPSGLTYRISHPYLLGIF